VKAAALCENVIEDKEGVLSLIRIVDRVVHTAAGSNAPLEMPPIRDYGITVVLMLVSGEARGSHNVTLALQQPSGLTQSLWSTSVLFEGEERGANLIVKLRLTLEYQGLYWVNVAIDDELATRIALRVVYTRSSGFAPS
jgi:hypothetical protein